MKLFYSALSLMICMSALGASSSKPIEVHLWHQMLYSHREVLAEQIQRFESLNPDIHVRAMFRETEELRSSFQAAAMAGSGPELVFGPSDQIGPFSAMQLIAPLDSYFSKEELAILHPLAVIRDHDQLLGLGDSIGNHLMLIYNKDLVDPNFSGTKSMEDLVQKARQWTPPGGYGLVFNMIEPFFFQPWIHAFGEGFMLDRKPLLNTPAVNSAFHWILDLKKQKIVPQECDYELANALFKQAKAPFIVNGDWSLGDYQKAGLKIGIAPLPPSEKTGLWPSPLVSSRVYSLNKSIRDPAKIEAALKFLRFMLSPETQKQFSKATGVFPSNLETQKDPELSSQELFAKTREILLKGRPMPIYPEIRAVWDSLRTQFQAVLSGTQTPEAATETAQVDAEKQIQVMNHVEEPGPLAFVFNLIFGAIALVLLYFVFRLVRDLTTQTQDRQGFLLMMFVPAMAIVFLVVFYPFFYNLVISVSNFSLRSFQNWQVIGLQHYREILADPQFYWIFGKTLIWTFTNVFLHTAIGVILALAIEQTLPVKAFWRALLIIPWAVPQYISALTWRGLFNQEFGPINVFLREFLHLSPVAWLSQPLTAFFACLVTNVWLGFPFMMVVALGGLQSIPKELYEAARLDGANAWQRFWNITWPLLQPVIRPSMALGCLWTFNTLNVVWLVSNGGEPSNQTHILVTSIYKSAFQLYQYGAASAGSVIIFVILLIATVLWTRWEERGRKT